MIEFLEPAIILAAAAFHLSYAVVTLKGALDL